EPANPNYETRMFGPDQVDLNYANPDVLLEILDVLLQYVRRGARIIRLDAIAYLWKTPGTSCIHQPQTHEVVKLMRTLLDAVAPGTILLTETNVPHAENVSYFGTGDEARMVYQFSLAPLLLDAFLTGDAGPFREWLTGLGRPPAGATYFNFTASHDGIGVRPLEGLVPAERVAALVESARNRGGRIGTRRQPDGSDSPYELNLTYLSALRPCPICEGPGGDDATHVRRFLASQSVMLSLAGIPGIYFQSLVGTPNDTEGVERTGQARSINRRKFQRAELDALLNDEESPQHHVFDGYCRLLQTRIAQPAFHPDAPQEVVQAGTDAVIAFRRGGSDVAQRILVTVNVSGKEVSLDPFRMGINDPVRNLLSDDARFSTGPLSLQPYQAAWWELRS
ncbi:MAG: sugar phosphorylase, partial [Planctomycetaceae bacterium]